MKALRVLLYNGKSRYFTDGSVKFEANAFIVEDSKHRILFVAPWVSIRYAEIVDDIPEEEKEGVI